MERKVKKSCFVLSWEKKQVGIFLLYKVWKYRTPRLMPKVSTPKIKPYYGKFDDNNHILCRVNISFLPQTFSGAKSTKALSSLSRIE